MGGASYIGGLASLLWNSSIENSYFKGKINLRFTASEYYNTNYIGGLIGDSYNDTIKKSYAQSEISNYNCISNKDNIGGLIGCFDDSTIENSYFKGKITSSCYTGGIIGYSDNSNIINNCYTTYLLDNSDINLQKGISSIGTPTTTSTYWNSELSKVLTDLSTAQGKTTNEMKNQATYSSWDFTNIWQMDPNINDGYPYLKELKDTI